LFSLDIETGEAELLLDNWNGLRFNSPNDLAVRTPTASCSSSGCSCIQLPACMRTQAKSPLEAHSSQSLVLLSLLCRVRTSPLVQAARAGFLVKEVAGSIGNREL